MPAEALALLERIKSMPEHQFWTDDLPATAALGSGQAIVGHRQVTDAYLLALARKRGGILATLDRGVLSLPRPSEEVVELVGAA